MGFDFTSLIGPGLGIVGGLLGPKSPAPYKPDPEYSNGLRASLRRLRGVGGQYGQMADRAQGQYNAYDTDMSGAYSALKSRLSADPYTDQYSQAKLQQATAGTTSAYQAARANLAASAAARGLSGGSSEMGAMGAIEAARAGTIAGAQNNLALSAIGLKDANARELLQLTEGLRGQAGNDIRTGLSGQAGVEGDIAGRYGQQLQTGYQQYADGAQRTTADNNSLLGILGQLGQGVGEYYGARDAKRGQVVMRNGRVSEPGGSLDNALPDDGSDYVKFIQQLLQEQAGVGSALNGY